METSKECSVFLLDYPGMEKNKDEVLRLLLLPYCQKTGCMAAISDSASSPMNIPYLYENAARAAAYCADDDPVVAYSRLPERTDGDSSLAYPYERLEALAACLRSADFDGARRLLQSLFTQLDQACSEQTHLPDFFVRCVLIDVLTLFSGSMNRAGVKFKSYSDLYFEALYLCRSCSYTDKRSEILSKIDALLSAFAQEYDSVTVHAAQIRALMEEKCCDADFSIQLLADHFHVSIAYMSYLFKKKFDQNFSDYLWELRLEKAKRLLAAPDLPIDQVAAQVGYNNASSFRRKFKQETGMTPSQFRDAQI